MPRFAYRCLAAIVSGLLAGGLLAGCGGGSPARSDRWRPVACWFHNHTKLRIDCGYLTVPLHHDRPGGRSIELAVEVIHTPSPHPQPDPVVLLQGGPGGTLVGNGNSAQTGYVPFRLLTSGRDLILLDQRGVGHSRPSLDCAPVYDLASGLACRNRLAARRIDLSAYTTQENAADVAELGPALGYRQVDLFGWSYGSLLALTVMREHPQHIRSAILLSPYPPQADPVADWPANVARAFRTLFDGCAHDRRCAAAYPHLSRDFRTAVTRLDARPRPLTVRSGTGGTGRLTGRGLVGLLYQGIALGKMAILPRAIHRAAIGGNLSDWARIAAAATTAATDPNLGINWGMSQSVQCADQAPFVNRQRARAIDAAHPEQRHVFRKPAYWFDLCSRWPTGPVDRAGHAPVHSTIPTLIVTGQYDTGVPPAYGRLAAATLTRNYFIEIPGLAHIPEGPCAESVEADFLHQPLRRPGTSCIQVPPIPWKTG